MKTVIKPVLGYQEMEALADHVAKPYNAAKVDAAFSKSEPFGFIRVDQLPPPRPPMACVQDRISGLHYAAHCIGITLAACGGIDLMHMVDGIVTDRHGVKVSAWLDHRWNGVQIPGGGMWCS